MREIKNYILRGRNDDRQQKNKFSFFKYNHTQDSWSYANHSLGNYPVMARGCILMENTKLPMVNGKKL
mgnify:CR=1 FL=1